MHLYNSYLKHLDPKKSQILFETFSGDGPESVVECGEVGHETITIDDTIVEKESSEDSDSVIIVHDDDDESVQVLYFCKIVRLKLYLYKRNWNALCLCVPN